MELNFIEVFTKIVLPLLTLLLTLWGWRARADKNKAQTELRGLKAKNEDHEIQNQGSWIDLYKKLHDDLAFRLTEAEQQISNLKRTIHKHEIAFKKANACPYDGGCPILMELSRSKDSNRAHKGRDKAAGRQREPP